MALRLTITRKIVAGIVMVVLVAALALLVAYDGLTRVTAAMRELAEVKEPSYSATLEVELNTNGIVMAALAYLDDPDPRYRRLVEADDRDVTLFHERYMRLATRVGDRRLGVRLGEDYGALRSLADSLMGDRDRQVAVWARVTQNFERADSIIDVRLHPYADADTPAGVVKVNYLRDLETELAEVGVSLGNNVRTRAPEPQAMIAANEQEFRATLARFRSLPLRPVEARHAAALDRAFGEMMQAVWAVLALERSLQRQSSRLLALRTRMDQLLDQEIQPLARQQLYEPRRAAEGIASSVLHQLQWLAPLALALGLATAVVLIRSIGDPVRQLKVGAGTVGRGDLSYRMTVSSRDEFAGVAAEFNRMVEQLQATTVSKELLERSEGQLRATVAQLKQEIAERGRLEASLSRSETMSAMGTLVAGVAHEVRNPLFGILSILEAMDARFGGREEHQRYLVVLRDQAERLNRLMRELLEYGKPPRHELACGSMTDVLAEALACSRPVADRAGVRLVSHILDHAYPVMLDRNRLLRVFLNLIENAIQHTAAGKAVMIESRVVDRAGGERWFECTIADAGEGFREADLPSVFQPFFTRRRGGTGLGLSITQRIVEEYGGSVTAANAARGGGVMAVCLPLMAATVPSLVEARHAKA